MTFGNLLRRNYQQKKEDIDFNLKGVIQKNTIHFQQILEVVYPAIKTQLLHESYESIIDKDGFEVPKKFMTITLNFDIIDVNDVNKAILIRLGYQVIRNFFNAEGLYPKITNVIQSIEPNGKVYVFVVDIYWVE